MYMYATAFDLMLVRLPFLTSVLLNEIIFSLTLRGFGLEHYDVHSIPLQVEKGIYEEVLWARPKTMRPGPACPIRFGMIKTPPCSKAFTVPSIGLNFAAWAWQW
jgi:hypothetical protein